VIAGSIGTNFKFWFSIGGMVWLLCTLRAATGDVDISGTWESDRSYTKAYLIKGRDLQLKWCGEAWSEAEIERRFERVKDAS
jgi:hypothetical protein